MFEKKDDNFEDLRRREEYERQKNEAFARGIGSFLYRIIMYFYIFLLTAMNISVLLKLIIEIPEMTSYFVAIVVSLFVFKIPYVREYPFKSLITLVFLLILQSVEYIL